MRQCRESPVFLAGATAPRLLTEPGGHDYSVPMLVAEASSFVLTEPPKALAARITTMAIAATRIAYSAMVAPRSSDRWASFRKMLVIDHGC